MKKQEAKAKKQKTGSKNTQVMQEMLNTLPFNVMYCNTDLTIQYMNAISKKTLKSIEHLLPVTADTVIGKSIDIFHKDPAHQRRLLSNPNNLPHRAIISIGEEKLDLNVNAVYENGKYVGAMVNWNVVTKSLEMENQMLGFKGVFDGLDKSQAIIEFNPDGTIIKANSNFLNAVNYSLNEIVGQHHRIFCDPKYAASQDYVQFWQKLNRGEFDSQEYLRFGKNGQEIWIQASYNPIVDGNGKVIKVVKFATDITPQKRQNLIYEGKVNAIGKAQAIIEFDTKGNVLNANENFLKALGYDLSEIKGKHHRMFCDPVFTASGDYKQFWESLADGVLQSGQYRRVGKGGKEVWINASYNPIFDQQGRVIMVVKFAMDITAQLAKQKEFEGYVGMLEETANSLASASAELMATATQMSASARQTNDQSGSVAAAAEEVSAGVQVVSTNTAQMVASIKEISKSANESADMSRSTSLSAQETNKTIAQLGASSKEIGEVIKVISSIAQQTNLLALNATIEAARAGDAGKGFAVVANEVKELAKQTAKATQDITNKISAIQHDSERAVDAIGGISIAIDKLNAIAGSIAASVEEQTATTNEVSRVVQQSSEGVLGIANNIKVVSKAAEESSVASTQTVDASKGLAVLAERLKDVVTKVKAA